MHQLASWQGMCAKKKLEASIEHTPRANVYGIECYNWNATLLPITLSPGLGCLLGTYRIQI